MDERRKLVRTRVSKTAKIFLNGRSPIHSCVVVNLTSEGAGVQIDRNLAIPASFALSFDDFRSIRQCRMIWRDEDRLGVAF